MTIKHYLIIASVIALSACASKVRLDDLPPVTDRGAAGDQGALSNSGQSGSSSNTAANSGLGNTATTGTGGSNTSVGIVKTVDANSSKTTQPDAGMLAKRSIYFDYDSFTIRDDAKAVLQAHAKHLSNNRSLKVALEGHTDERGGSEYNLALGQKRANAVQEALQLLGVPANQMEAVSFGKEKPKALGNDEAGYAENRRGDIQYK
jgi:peptidoglycan-associated lipoprotein